MNKKIKYSVCSYCDGSPWIFRLEKRKSKKSLSVIFPCPMCNPHGDRMPMEVDMNEINMLIEERKKIIPKELQNRNENQL